MEVDAGEDLAYIDDEMDEDFVPPSKRHSPRRSLKPSSGVSMKRSEDNSTPKPATGTSREKDSSSSLAEGGGGSYNKL